MEDKLKEYDFELDPPTMEEFQLFLRLGNMLDMWDHPEAWTELQIDEELCEIADLLDEAGKKYDRMLLDWHKAQEA